MIDTIFPHRCALCDEVLPAGEKRGVCAPCAARKVHLKDARCMKCGKELSKEREYMEYCPDCERIDHVFDRGFSVFSYREVAASLYRFKYAGRREYADYYARSFVRHYRGIPRGIRVDALIPVPLSGARYRQRGYNQAEDFARALSDRTGIPVYHDLIARVRDTKPQKMLDYYGRRNNLKNAFIMKKNDVELKSVAVVDDIYTTGSTTDEIASLLKRNGVHRVYVFTPAIGKLR